MGHFSYPETMDEFLAHWALADAALLATGAPPLTILTGTPPAALDRAGFQLMAGTHNAKLDALAFAELEGRIASGETALRREALLAALATFNDTVRAWWASQPEAALVPALPGKGVAHDTVLKTARHALRLWDRLNAGPAPAGITLPLTIGPAPGMDRAAFATLRDAFAAARDAQETAEFTASALRAERDNQERHIRAALNAYTRTLPVRLGPAHPILQSLPRLTPLPGHTPQPVTLRGSWDPSAAAALLDWDASDDPALESYQIRWCPGDDYNKKEERVALTLTAASGIRTAHLRQGLEPPGTTATYKVYVILKSGNERGSRAVPVARS